ncbi:hypothetical protein KSF_106910 [Reticulibacter mediterranei]|uniref:Pentapeptide repeat-containing protein n=1 Tax=Reticulibacter mediterranei TaxID=2778369 RepID=A0A8J3N9D1_9CHLR|nr:hypothetical protein KSF_106910 [Reticulibacter mediterranei]
MLQKFLSRRSMPLSEDECARFCAFLKKDLQGVDLQKENLTNLHLEGFNFAKAQLQGANLSGSNLRGATFTRANLTGTRCYHTQLQGAVLRQAALCDADLRHADLTEANLIDANLTRANFAEATLSHANCSRVQAQQAYFAYAVLTDSTWDEANLEGACLNAIEGSGVSFAQARLRYTTVSHAVMKEANLRQATCSSSDWSYTNLQRATLMRADFSLSNLQGINVEDASLDHCSCRAAAFGTAGLRYNSKTSIDVNNHDLISMVLLSRAQTAVQKQFALYIRHETNLCWSGFTKLLLCHSTEMRLWVKETLWSVESLQASVQEYERYLTRWAAGEGLVVELRHINASLHHLMNEEIRKQASLKKDELYWFLRGVFTSACQQPGIVLSEEQHAAVIHQLRVLTNQ